MSDRAALPYFIISTLLLAVSAHIPKEDEHLWDHIGDLIEIIAILSGTIYCYKANGGARGRQFLQRYFSVSWVVGQRILSVMIPALIVYMIGVVSAGIALDSPQGAFCQCLFNTALTVLIYWRIGHHLRFIADTGNKPIPAFDSEIEPVVL